MSLQDELGQAIRFAFDAAVGEGTWVTDWVVTAEVIVGGGERVLHTLRSPDCAAWKALGMLESHVGDVRESLRP